MQFGTDPEFLVVDASGHPVPAHKAGFNDKTKKHPSGNSSDGGKYFRDGYMLEINVFPTSCRQSLTYRVQRTLGAVKRRLDKQGLHLGAKAAVQIDLAKDMARAPRDVKQFGCEPSFCAHDLVAKVPPIDAMTHPWRYAGAHLHFSAQYQPYEGPSWSEPVLNEPDAYPELIKLFDQYIGLPLTCLFHSTAQYQRRKYYGQAGEYRPQQYGKVPGYGVMQRGVEYRTPGPELWNTVWLPSLILGIGRDVIMRFGTLRKTLDKHRVAAVRHAIDTGENRWTLLQAFRAADGRINPATWKMLHFKFQKSRLLGPIGVIEAESEEVEAGYRGWRYPDQYLD